MASDSGDSATDWWCVDANSSLQRIPSLRTIPDLVFRLSKLKRVVLSGNPQLQLTTGSQVSLSITQVYVSRAWRDAAAQSASADGILAFAHVLRTNACGWSRHLASCELTRAPLQLIDSMPELRVLDLSQNRITALDEATSAAPWKLQVLYVLARVLCLRVDLT